MGGWGRALQGVLALDLASWVPTRDASSGEGWRPGWGLWISPSWKHLMARPTPIRLTLRESSAALAFVLTLRVTDARQPSDAWLTRFAALGRVRQKLALAWTEAPVTFTRAEGDALLWALSTARVRLASASDRGRFHRRMLGLARKMRRAGWRVPSPDDGIGLVANP